MPLPSLLDEIDRLFNELVHRPWGSEQQLVPAEVREVQDGWVIEMHVQGLRAGDLRVDVHGRRLIVSGQRHRQEERSGQAGWKRARREVAFSRTLTLPIVARPEDVEARLENSTLTIHVRRHPS